MKPDIYCCINFTEEEEVITFASSGDADALISEEERTIAAAKMRRISLIDRSRSLNVFFEFI